MNVLVVVYSFHHHNTKKIAQAFAEAFSAEIKTPQHIAPETLHAYDLVGFGSGIHADQHHQSLLNLADSLTQVTDKRAFLFSRARAFAQNLKQAS